MTRDEEVQCPKCHNATDVETYNDDDEGAEVFCHNCQHCWDTLWD